MANLIGFLVNYEDPIQRKSMPSGLLITIEGSNQIIALGESSLSNLLAGLYLAGIQYVELDKYHEQVTKKIKPNDLASFRKVGKEYLAKGRLKMSEVAIIPPLNLSIEVTEDLRLSKAKEPFEVVKLRNSK